MNLIYKYRQQNHFVFFLRLSFAGFFQVTFKQSTFFQSQLMVSGLHLIIENYMADEMLNFINSPSDDEDELLQSIEQYLLEMLQGKAGPLSSMRQLAI